MQFNHERAALILVEAAYYGDRATGDRWGVSIRSIQRYRARLDSDQELSQLVALKKEAFERDWTEEMPAAIRTGIRFLNTAFQEADPTSPEAIHAVAGAMKILAEIGLTREVLNVRFYGKN